MSKRKKKHKVSGKHIHTPLTELQRRGSKLVGAMSSLNMNLIDWERDYLPEFIWIAAVAEYFGIDRFHDPYNAFLDAVDKVWIEKTPALGLLSDFSLIPEATRQQFLDDNSRLIELVFHKPIARVLAFYPECPAHWLIIPSELEAGGSLDPAVELGHLRSLVLKLLPGKTEFPARVRAVPLNRLFKHDKLYISKDVKGIDALSKYPVDCTPEEKHIVETLARSSTHLVIQQRPDLVGFNWSQYFWRHNYDLTPCKERERQVIGASTVSPEHSRPIEEALLYNADVARKYLNLLRLRYRIDLYDPKRDEVLFGLFSRMTRLFCLMTEDPNLWARDVGGIILRCLSDTAITFCYLATKGSPDDFKNFIQYGEGQQKLLMLHLQDNYPADRSLEGETSLDISERMGGFTPELLDIELGHWLKKDARKLAKEAGMEKLYSLVYNPASGDVHGTWLALKETNLSLCMEPLHRFHRLPSFIEPPFFVNIADVACSLYEHCLGIGVEHLRYPANESAFRKIAEVTGIQKDSSTEEDDS